MRKKKEVNELLLYENFFGRIMTRIFDLMILNLLFVLTSLPIISMGASFAALNATMLKIIEQNDDKVYEYYLKIFIQKFKQSTSFWISLLILLLLLVNNFQYMSHIEPSSILIIKITQVLIILALTISIFVFFLLPKYEMTLYELLKNSFFIAISYLPYTFLLLLITFGPFFITLFFNIQLYGLFLYFYLIIGISLTCYINAYLIEKILNLLKDQNRII